MLATWTDAAFADLGTLPVLMSDDEVLAYVATGYIELASANHFFLCPLLPVK